MITPYVPKSTGLIPELITCWDTETYQGKVIAVTGYNRNEDGSLNKIPRFDDLPSFMNWLLLAARSDKRLQVLYAHNSGKFEGNSVFQWLKNDRVDLLKNCRILMDGQGEPISISIKLSKRVTIRFEDSMRRMGKSSLESLAKSFKTPHQKRMDLITQADYRDMENFKKTRPDDFWTYAEEDSLILLEIMETFEKGLYSIFRYDKLPLTIGSIALLMWRYFLKEEIAVPKSKRVNDFIRRGYVGGRVEAFYQTVADVVTYDVNSLFPSVMIDYPVPVSYVGFWTKRWKAKNWGFYHVRFSQTNKNVYPVLRDETSKKYVYQGEGVFCHTELKRLLEVGGNFTVIKGYIFTEWKNIFKEVQTMLYSMKQSAKKDNPALYQIVKLLLNSLYGKFGQKEITSEIRALDDNELIDLVQAGNRVVMVGDGYYQVYKYARVEHAFVAIAATITANARVRQHEYMSLVPKQAMLYTDTDCFHIVKEYRQPFDSLVSDRCGMLKEEHSGLAVYAGPKTYAIRTSEGDILRSKGCPHNFTFDDMYQLVTGEIPFISVPYESVTTFKQLGKLNACVFTPRIRNIRVTIGA